VERTGPLTRPDVSDDGSGNPPAQELPTIESIGRFRVTAKLGEGGMGVVYAAHDSDLDRAVAIKLLRPSPSDPQPARSRLLREARAMAKLSHPNVITVYDVGTEGEDIFIAMELVRGVNLRRWIAMRPRTWRATVECFVDAGRGLAAAHRAGIIHRDFKPDNVLVGEDGRVRVLDFGLARPSSSEDEPTPRSPQSVSRMPTTERLTQTGAVIGTPAYMAPEQWRGAAIGERTDQFSFCVALWEALFGTRPFAGEAPTALAARVMSGEIQAPNDPGDVPSWLVRVLRRGLGPQPEDRYPSMDALLDVLARLRRDGNEHESAPRPERPTVTGPLFARRYELGAAAAGMTGITAKDRLTRRNVAIERIGPVSMEPNRVAKLRALANLRHPNVVTVLDHCIADGNAYLVSEHHDGAVEIVEHSRDQPRAIQLALVAQLLRAVAYLHAHDLVHLRLSPRTVRVVDGQVKLGELVACLLESGDTTADAAYLAPEVLLGEGRSALADLFSVGVLAHELLTGRRPHRSAAPGELVDEVLTSSPAMVAGDLDPPLAATLRRLLDPDPRRRFSSAAEALRALVATSRGSLTVETVETRECALRSARFAGREVQMGQLVNALRRSVDGAGEMWLLGGESGIGKSRFLDELAAQAIARGATVIRGQARAEGGRPYEIWREVFRLLALASPDEAIASVLAPLVPDIDRLRGQPHKAAPDLDAKNTQQRLGRVVASAIRGLATPLVVLLDDVQWAGSESIDLLQRLAQRLAGLSVLVVAGYRNDELALLAEPLTTTLPEAKSITLGPLDPEAITELAIAMTGAEGSELHALLMRETEGHALLFVEVMRFLAEEAGDLHGVATMEVPAAVAAGGVRRAMRRRLERVEAWARPVLEVAAVAGREIDMSLLERFVPADEVARALTHAVDSAVLEHDGERWRFRHDKLREHLLSDLAEARRRELHRGVGEAIRDRYGADESHVQAMAHHFREAGQLADEARCSGIAGEQALANGAYRDAARLLSRAIELRGHVELERVDLVRWHRKLGEAHYVLGDLSRAVEGLGGALRELGRPLPQSRPGWMFLLLRLVLAHVFLMVMPGRFVARKPRRRDELHEGANAAGRLANLSTYSGDVLRIFACSLLSANLAERAGRPSAYSLAVMGYSASYMGMPRIADRYFARASAAAIDQDDPTALVEATQMECAYRLGAGEFERCKQLLEAGYAAAERADYQLGLALAEGFVGQCEYHLGNFQAMLAHYSRARELLTMRSPEHEHSFLCGEAHALCMLGRFDEAERTLARAAEGGSAQYLLGEAFVLATRCYLRAWGSAHDGALAAAVATNRHVAEHGIAIPPPCGHVLTAPAEALLTAARSDARGEAVVVARKHSATLDKWARRHAVGEAPAILFGAQLDAQAGDTARAIEGCERSLVSAKRLGLRFSQAQAELELGRMRGPTSVPGRGHLERARDLCIRCGAGHHRKIVDALLEQTDDDVAQLRTAH